MNGTGDFIVDFIVDIISKIVVDVAAGEILEMLRRILHGEELTALAEGGNQAAAALASHLENAGIDPATVAASDWSQVADQAESHFGEREMPADFQDGLTGEPGAGADGIDWGGGGDHAGSGDWGGTDSGGTDSGIDGGADGGGFRDGGGDPASDSGDPAGF